MHDIEESIRKVKDEIDKAKERAGRKNEEVNLIAVSKFHGIEEIESAIKAGHRHFGENRAKEALEKFSVLKAEYPDIVLHFIGHLQRNKVGKVLEIADTIDSVDSTKLLYEIEKQCSARNMKMKIMMELHTGEESKSGFRELEEMKEAIAFARESRFLTVRGIMSVAPVGSEEEIRRSFAFTRKVRDEMLALGKLSMGMSGDFEMAIGEGSDEVRVGTAIFGERK